MDRRTFLHAAAGLAASLSWPALASDYWSQPRELWLVRASTGEQIRETYFADGALVQSGYVAACRLLRDVQAGQAVTMSLVTLDILCGIRGWFAAQGYDRPFMVTSGYRSAATNAATEGAVRNSEHVRGTAVDGYVPGVPADYLARLGLYLRGGGVGWYPSRHFVHLDAGRVRAWRG